MSTHSPDASAETVRKWVEECFDRLLTQDHVAAMKRCDVVYLPSRETDSGRYIVNVLNKTYTVELGSRSVLELTTGRAAGEKLSYVILEYLMGWGTPVVQQDVWQSMETLTAQPPYKYHYQKFVIRPLERLFGYDKELFASVSTSLGGKSEKLGGVAYSFKFLPKIKSLVQLWVGSSQELTKPRINTSFNRMALNFLRETPLLFVFEVLVQFMEKEAKKKRSR
ncbi:MAG: DUF3786 domain-containing protein [Candidatus Caldarchaeum sp.]|uniref:DUF3786 domain-containing protein n=1 Tax=Caldiarchaeum subterraneum TaxID=311458 RepID=A0A7C5L7Y8_CALS0